MDTLASPACYCCLFIIAVVSARHRRPSFVSQVSTSATEMSVSALLQGVIQYLLLISCWIMHIVWDIS